ncbi:MAG: antibiotic biosynthesis monooxygenase [Planctomycetaceae bacterium]|nr:antibiotic biosynthesis monooxygenase [Planctomycetaceae bacterium]
MFCINVILQVQDPARIDEIRDHLRRAGELSRTEPGCLVFEVGQDQNDAACFVLTERWVDKLAWEVHKTAEAFTTIYQPLVLPHVERTPHFCNLIQ